MNVGHDKSGTIISRHIYSNDDLQNMIIYGTERQLEENFIKPNMYQKGHNLIVFSNDKKKYLEYSKILSQLDENNRYHNVCLLNFNVNNPKFCYNPILFPESEAGLLCFFSSYITSFKFTARKKMNKELLSRGFEALLYYIALYVFYFEEKKNKNLKRIHYYLTDLYNNGNFIDQKMQKIVVEEKVQHINRMIKYYICFKALPLEIQKEAIYQIKLTFDKISKEKYYNQLNSQNSILFKDIATNDTAIFVISNENEKNQHFSISNLFLYQFLTTQRFTNETVEKAKLLMKYGLPFFSVKKDEIQKLEEQRDFHIMLCNTQDFLYKADLLSELCQTNPHVSLQLLTNNETKLYNKLISASNEFYKSFNIFVDYTGKQEFTKRFLHKDCNEQLKDDQCNVIKYSFDFLALNPDLECVVDEIYNYKKHPNYEGDDIPDIETSHIEESNDLMKNYEDLMKNIQCHTKKRY